MPTKTDKLRLLSKRDSTKLKSATPTEYVEQTIHIIDWLKENPTSVSIIDYYLDETTTVIIPFDYYKKNPHLKLNTDQDVIQIKSILDEVLKNRIIKLSLTNKFNAWIAKMLLINDYGMSDKTEQEVSVVKKEIVFEFNKRPDKVIKFEEAEEIIEENGEAEELFRTEDEGSQAED